MTENKFDTENLIRYWQSSSDDDFDTMEAMFDKEKYHWALFVGHLMMEKLLKALYVKTHNEYPPMIHNLLRLAEKCNLQLDDDQKVFLATVTAFNINARYDDYKMSFRKKCTREFAIYWTKQLTDKRLWIRGLITQ
jgi:HEPN domain-containing protein